MYILFAIILLIILYPTFIRRTIDTWGATKAEVQATLPGDELITSPDGQSTRAITINAPAGVVWPWLVQLGQGRGGFYSYDWLENLLGMDIHSADSILTEFQQLDIGDDILLTKNGPVYKVSILEPSHAIILRMPDQKTFEFPNPDAPDYYDTTWGFILKPINDHKTRLIIRGRGASNTLSGKIVNFFIGPIGLIMEQKMLRGIKLRAEYSVNL